MNKYTLLFLFAFVATIAKGQEYSSLLIDGRTWHYRVEVTIGEEMATTFTDAFFYGDTIIAGIPCKKLYCDSGYDNDMSTSSRWFPEIGLEGKYHSAWYEDGKKVYRIMNETTTPELIFDFGLQVGDNLPNNESIVYKYDDYITVNGNIEGELSSSHTYRRLHFNESGTGNGELSDWCLVEGIGGNEGILYTEFQTTPINGCIYEHLMYCSQFLENKDGYPVYEMLFGKNDFLKDNYIPFVQEGRSWHYVLEILDGYHQTVSSTNEEFYFEGDEVIDGLTYKKFFYKKDGEEPRLLHAMREENDKVYCYMSDTNGGFDEKINDTEYSNPLTLYDYTLPIGSVFPFVAVPLWDNYGFGDNDLPLLVTKDVTLTTGMHTTMYVFGKLNDENRISYGYAWFRGLGSIAGWMPNEADLLTGGRWSYREYCVSVNQGGEVLATANELNSLYNQFVEEYTAGIQVPVNTTGKQIPSMHIYNLQGQQLKSVPQKGVYIQGGKKRVAY